jgi:Uma2 family endonuclease
MVATNLLTAEDLLNLRDDGYRYELEWGVLRRMPPPSVRHGRIMSRVCFHMEAYADESGAGVVFANGGVIVEQGPDVVRGPDVAFVTTSRLPPDWDFSGYLPFGPDLAIEIISPSEEQHDIEKKIAEYFAAGTRLVWLFDPETRTVTARRPDGSARVDVEGEEVDGEDVLPGFRLAVAEIFR